MAYLKDVSDRCQSCRGKAVSVLMNRNDVAMGQYCKRCAPIQRDRLQQKENEADRIIARTSPGG